MKPDRARRATYTNGRHGRDKPGRDGRWYYAQLKIVANRR